MVPKRRGLGCCTSTSEVRPHRQGWPSHHRHPRDETRGAGWESSTSPSTTTPGSPTRRSIRTKPPSGQPSPKPSPPNAGIATRRGHRQGPPSPHRHAAATGTPTSAPHTPHAPTARPNATDATARATPADRKPEQRAATKPTPQRTTQQQEGGEDLAPEGMLRLSGLSGPETYSSLNTPSQYCS